MPFLLQGPLKIGAFSQCTRMGRLLSRFFQATCSGTSRDKQCYGRLGLGSIIWRCIFDERVCWISRVGFSFYNRLLNCLPACNGLTNVTKRCTSFCLQSLQQEFASSIEAFQQAHNRRASWVPTEYCCRGFPEGDDSFRQLRCRNVYWSPPHTKTCYGGRKPGESLTLLHSWSEFCKHAGIYKMQTHHAVSVIRLSTAYVKR